MAAAASHEREQHCRMNEKNRGPANAFAFLAARLHLVGTGALVRALENTVITRLSCGHGYL